MLGPQTPILLRMTTPPSQQNPDRPPSRALGLFGTGLLVVGVALSLGLSFGTTLWWGLAAGDLRSQRKAGVPDEELTDLIARVDSLAQGSLWVALGAVPLGLVCVVAGLIVRGRANRRPRRASHP